MNWYCPFVMTNVLQIYTLMVNLLPPRRIYYAILIPLILLLTRHDMESFTLIYYFFKSFDFFPVIFLYFFPKVLRPSLVLIKTRSCWRWEEYCSINKNKCVVVRQTVCVGVRACFKFLHMRLRGQAESAHRCAGVSSVTVWPWVVASKHLWVIVLLLHKTLSHPIQCLLRILRKTLWFFSRVQADPEGPVDPFYHHLEAKQLIEWKRRIQMQSAQQLLRGFWFMYSNNCRYWNSLE